MNVLSYIFFYFFIYVVGDFFRKKIFNSEKIYGLNLAIFNPLYVLIIFGNIMFLSNFLLRGYIFAYLIIVSSTFLFFYSLNKISLSFERLFPFIFISFLLSFSTYGITDHYDFGFYHLLNQSWIFNEKIVFGLSNIMFPLGNQSIYEYISAIFFISDNYVILHFLNLVPITIFFHFLYECFKLSSTSFLKLSSLVIVLFGFLDNFGYLGGANGFPNFQHVGKPDITVGVLVIIFNILIINYLKHKKYNNDIFRLLTLLTFFLIQLKPTSFYILLIFIYALLKDKIYFLKNSLNIKFNFIISFVSIFWIIKNIIVSGCVVFPVKFLCFDNLNWSSTNLVNQANQHYSSTYFPYILGDNVIEWFQVWKKINANYQITVNFIASYIIIYFVSKIFTEKINNSSNDSNFIRFYLVFSLVAFFISVPLFRYSFGILSSLVLLIVLNRKIKDKYTYGNNSVKIFMFLFILTTLFLSRGYSFSNAIKNPIAMTNLVIPETHYVKATNWGVIPLKTKNNPNIKCWDNLDCNPEDKELEVYDINGYYFILESKR